MNCVLNAYSDDDVFINVYSAFSLPDSICAFVSKVWVDEQNIYFMPILFCLLIKFVFSILNRNLLPIKITKSHRFFFSYRFPFSGGKNCFLCRQKTNYLKRKVITSAIQFLDLLPEIMQIITNETRHSTSPWYCLGIS